MADKNSVTDWSETAADNDNVGGVPLGENVMLPSNVNNAFRVMMAQLKAFFKSSVFRVRDGTDETKLLALDLSGLTTATTRTQIVPDENGRQALQPHLAGHLYGLTLANNATDAANDIDIATGSAIDSTNTHVMTLASAITKRLDAAWAAGTGNGGLDTGAIANTTYHLYLIKRVDTGVVDVIFSASAAAPTLPTGYTLYRRIGSILRQSGTISSFTQRGDVFKWTSLQASFSATGTGNAALTITAIVPTGLVVEALININLLSSAGNTCYISDLTSSDLAPSSQVATVGATATNISGTASVFTSTLGTFRARLAVGSVAETLNIYTVGWVDTRGRT